MFLLTTITDKLQVVTSAAVAIDVHASWVDNAAGTITPGRTNTAITTATTTDVVVAPGASTQRNIKTLTVRNKDAASSNDVTVKHTDGTTAVELFKLTLLAGHELLYLDGIGFSVSNTLGQILGQGAAGVAGAQGIQGPASPSLIKGDDGDDGCPLLGMPSGISTRALLGPDAKNWTFLGRATGAAVTVGPVVWTGQYKNFYFEYVITGYNGGTPIGRVLTGAASISTTALTNGNGLCSGVTLDATSVSKPGCPLAVTASLIGRSGSGFIYGDAGSFKQYRINGMNGTPAVATSPTLFQAASFFSDLGSNPLLQRIQLSVYDTLIATAVSVQTFLAGTYISIWGRNDD